MANSNTNEDVILNIQVSNSEALDKINKYNKQLQELKDRNKEINAQNKELEKANKDLAKEVANGTKTQQEASALIAENNEVMRKNREQLAENALGITALNNASRIYQREIQNNIIEQNNLEGSLVTLRAQLSNATAAYDRMSETERNSAKGKELKDHINEITDKLKGAEEETQRFYRNVGNYQDALINAAAGNNEFARSLLQATTSGEGMKGMLKSLGLQLKALFDVLIANPIIVTVAAIVAAFMLLSKAFQRNEENMNKMNVVLAKVGGLFQWLLKILEPIASFLVDVLIKAFDMLTEHIEKQINALASLMEFFGLDAASKWIKDTTNGIKEMAEESARLAKAEANLREEQRKTSKIQRAYQQQAEKLRALRDDDNKSIAERVKANDELTTILKAQLQEELRIANQSLEVAKARAKVYGNTAENLDAIASAEDKIAELNNRLLNTESEQLKSRNNILKQASDKYIEIRKKELAAINEMQKIKYESEINHLKDLASNQDKSHQERLNALYQANVKEIEALKYAEDQELKQQGLTGKEKELIKLRTSQRLLELEKELSDNTIQLMKDEEAKQLDAFKKNLENRLAVIKEGSNEELSLKLEQLALQEQAEIASAEKVGADIALIRAKYRQLEAQEQEKQEAYLSSQRQKEFQNKILEAQLEGQNTLALQLEQKTAQLEALKQLEGESDVDYYNRQLVLKNELKNLEDDYLNYQLETRVQVMQATADIAGGFQELFESMAENNVAFAGFAKAMALYQIGIDTATALTAGVKQAQSVPFPGNIAAIATTVATILSNIAKAKKYLTSSKEPKAPKFNQGGLVVGEGSGTSDSIRAYLSNGESVMTARTTAMFSPILSAFNQIGGGVPISTQDTSNQVMGEEMLSKAFAKAVATLPNPVVSVQEIDNVNNRIEVLESSRSL